MAPPPSPPGAPKTSAPPKNASEWNAEGERIAKALARAGICSRRDAERLIAEGRVKLNGKTLQSPAVNVSPSDEIRVDNRPIGTPEPTRLWRYHKPAGLVTTHRDPAGRPTVFERLPENLPRVISVGRLDLTSEGLLLLTNDGELARRLELPSNGWKRRYRARAFGRVTQADLDQLAEGISVEGVNYGPIVAELERQQSANAWITLSLSEGKNREVRRVLEALGLKVNRLIRTSYGPFQLGTMEPGAVEEIPAKVVRDQVGQTAPKTGEPKARKPRKTP
jgi:23S rRNA pseudouridine2605 synthase